jgi:hypothetical protein
MGLRRDKDMTNSTALKKMLLTFFKIVAFEIDGIHAYKQLKINPIIHIYLLHLFYIE